MKISKDEYKMLCDTQTRVEVLTARISRGEQLTAGDICRALGCAGLAVRLEENESCTGATEDGNE